MFLKNLNVCTVSKFPPYMSGHSFESMYQGRALYEFTGRKHFELTYHPDVYDKKVNFNDSKELKEESEKYLNVYRVKPFLSPNVKVFDGALVKAFTGKLIDLIENQNINVLSTYYLDPHAYIANQASLYSQRILKKRIITVHKAVGSDVLNSIGNHLDDGEGKYILLQLLAGDVMLAVSAYTKAKIIDYAEKLLPSEITKRLDNDVKVLYAPFNNDFFGEKDLTEQTEFRKKFNVNPKHKVISYFGRIFPEKGIEDLLNAYDLIKKEFPYTTLIVGGSGIKLQELKRHAARLRTPDIVFTGSVSDSEKRSLMQISDFGVIPTKPVSNFVETLCICALEYQAAGTPLITTRVGGVPEAAGSHSIYAEHSNPNDLAEKMLLLLRGNVDRNQIIAKGIRYTAKFNYRTITKKFLDYIDEVHSDSMDSFSFKKYLRYLSFQYSSPKGTKPRAV